jgi:hypothetical protein
MKPEEKKKLRINMVKHFMSFPKGLEVFFPIDEKALQLLDIGDSSIDDNVEKYFNEQSNIKTRILELSEKINKEFAEYQNNCNKLVEYIKGLNL